ncbi:hypothetical protein MASR2M39_25460 [Ignavibacteriales bacterium]
MGDQYRETWPAMVMANVTDNIGLDSVYVLYKKNTSGTVNRINLSLLTEAQYSGVFGMDTANIAVGDTLYYRIAR